MDSGKPRLGFCLSAIALLAGCGNPGTPLPPSLELARPVTDLRATRKGDKVYLTWSTPTQTTERRNIRHFGPTQICRSTAAEMRDCGTPVAEVAARPTSADGAQPANKPQASFTDQLSSNMQGLPERANIVYALNVLNSYGKSAGLSNRAQVPAAPVLPAPADFQAELTAEGVRLAWRPGAPGPEIPGFRYEYRIYRRELESGNDAVAGELPLNGEGAPSLTDHGFEWEKTYDYRATVVTLATSPNAEEQQVEGEDSSPVRVIAHDVFPPAVPSGLQAVFSGAGQKPFIDLVWAPDSDSDLLGYNVYRYEQGVPPTKQNSEPLKSPTFRDSQVSEGHEYIYRVSAVDVRGNESGKSEEARETVP